jgi:hypothetical protein
MTSETSLVPADEGVTALTPERLSDMRRAELEVIKGLMKPGLHYGKIPGTPKPSLWQPGAQLIDKAYGYAPTFQCVAMQEDWEKPFFHYTYRCRLIRRRDGVIVGEAEGSCNSREKKYREATYHGKDEGTPVDPCDIVNTLQKMAQKRAHVSATLNATALTDVFTQDIEDLDDFFPAPKRKAELRCGLHDKPLRNGKYGAYCPTRVTGADGKERWCKGQAVTHEKLHHVDVEPVEPGELQAAGEFPTPQSPGPPLENPTSATTAGLTGIRVDSLGDLFNACKEHFGIKAWPEIFRILNVSDKMDIADVQQAWQIVCAFKQEPTALPEDDPFYPNPAESTR